MHDLRFAFRQLLKNPGFTAVAMPGGARTRLLARLPRSVARREFKTRDQQNVHDLVIVGPVVAVNEHLAPAGGQGDVILMFHEQPATVSHMNDKRPKGAIVKQLPNLVCFHAPDDSPKLLSGKARSGVDGACRITDSIRRPAIWVGLAQSSTLQS